MHFLGDQGEKRCCGLVRLSKVFSHMKQPRRNDWQYKCFLYTQFFIFCVALILPYRSNKPILCSILAAEVPMFFVAKKFREIFARKPDEELSDILTRVVLKESLFVGTAQLLFLVSGTIQCEGKVNDLTQCNRTLYSQTGLGLLVVVYLGIKIFINFAPKYILDKHIISIKKIVPMNLNLREKVLVFGLSIAGASGMFLLGSYGAEGDFDDDMERITFVIVTIVGVISVSITALWKAVVIWFEIKQEAKNGPQINEKASDDNYLTEVSSFWFYVAVFVTTLESLICTAAAITEDYIYVSISKMLLPFAAFLYGGSVLFQPRRVSYEYMWKLRLHFVSFAYISFGALAVLYWRKGGIVTAVVLFLIAGGLTRLFQSFLKLRASVAQLVDKGEKRVMSSTQCPPYEH